MKRKIFSILFTLVLVLSFSLIPAVPVSADGASPRGMLGTTDIGEAEWTQGTKQCGDYSAKLHWPQPYTPEGGSYTVPRAFVSITGLPDGTTINDVTSWSYWVNVKDVEAEHPGDGEDYCPNLTFYLDTDGDGAFNSDNDTTVTAWPEPSIVTDWCQIDETTIGGYDGAYTAWEGGAGAPKWKFDWAAVQSSYGTQEILKLKVGKGVIGTGIALTVYADDLIMNGVTYEFEPPPTCYVSATGSDNNLGTEGEPFATIQRGVNIVAESGTVHVAAGTYTETITFASGFATDNLTIQGDVSNRPVVDGGVLLDNDGAINGITLKNLYFKGSAGQSGSSTYTFRMSNTDAVNNFAMDNCVFDGQNVSERSAIQGNKFGGTFSITNTTFKNILGWAVLDIDSSGGGYGGNELVFTNVTFTGNTIQNCNGSVALRGNHATKTNTVNAYNNAFTNLGGNEGEAGMQWAALEINHAATANVSNNTISNVSVNDWGNEGQAFQFWDIDTLDCHDNTISNCYQGIYIFSSGIAGYPVEAWGGPYAIPGGVADGTIYNNDITDCDQYGIKVESTATGGPLDATNNWWGHATGPKHTTTNPNGLGSEVSDNVTYTHWYLVPKDDVGIETEVEEEDYGQQSQEFENTNTTVDTSGTEGDGDITVKTYDYTVPEDAEASLAASVEGKQALKYVDVKLENSTYSGDVCITISYTDADLAQMGVEESDLALYYWDMPDGPWTLASNSSVDTDANTVSGCIPASELTGTPICLGGEAEATGQYEVGEPPTVTAVTFTPTEMDPQVEQTVTVGVSVPAGESRTLGELSEVLFKVWYDGDGNTPTESEFNDASANVTTCGIITWTPSGNFTADFDSSTTWSSGNCTAPTLTGTSGTFTLKFTPGKVATETTGGPVWQVAATATSEYGTSDLGYDAEATAMNWYGEMALGATVNVDWGSIPAGMDFDNTLAEESLGTTVTYISNGGYSKQVKSSATWEGISNTANLDSAGNCAATQEFALKADNTDTLPDNTHLLNTTGAEFDTGGLTIEAGNAESTNYLWLKLASTFDQDTYSGTITYIIQND